MIQIEFVDGNLNYVDHCRLDGRLDIYRFGNIFDNIVGALMLHRDDFFLLREVKEECCSVNDDTKFDFVRIVFRSFDFSDEKVSDIVQAFLYCFKVTL